MNNKIVKQLPYGLSNYERLIQKNCYYIDKTMYLRDVESAGDYLFFIRPRRFGKSLFLSTMEAYYDVYYKDRFEELFNGTAIYSQPTKERGAYLVLKFNFSTVEPAVDKVEASFLNNVRGTALSFIRKYTDHLLSDREYYIKTIGESGSASDILETLVRLCRDSNRKTYAVIDEYDNFANTILSSVGEDAYHDLTRGKGFFRSFFNVLKGGTDGMGAPFTRLFLTGVSPITLDDLTSGYNIGENVSLDAAFNQMLGFTETDVREMVNYYRGEGLISHETDDLLDVMGEWYGNYLFSKHSDMGERLYNPDMVLYFLREYFKNRSIPGKLIDRNVRTDYAKLRYLILLDRGKGKAPTSNGNFERLKEIIEKGETVSDIEDGFPLEKLAARENFISLLFYFGLLTIKRVELNDPVLAIPNETVRRLYYDYIKEAYEETDVFALDIYTYRRLMKAMAMKGEWQPLFDYITGRMRESMSLRDLMTGEKAVQAFLNVYLGLSNLYIIHTEKELNKGYADIVAEPFLEKYEGIRYSYMLEIKYLKAGAKPGEAAIRRLKTEAGEQLKTYGLDEKFRKAVGKTTLVKLVLIFSGHELLYIGEVK